MTGANILSVVSEIYPLVKTGGLGDVAGALPLALREHGIRTVTLVPGYPAVLAALGRAQEVFSAGDLFGGRARLLAGRASGLDLLAIEAPHLFDRSGNPYVGPDGRDWPDNALRFGALGWMAARIGLGEVSAFLPDIVHCHDWQAGLAPAYLAYDGRRRPPSVITVNNLAYQGLFPADLLSTLHLPPEAFRIDGVEYYGGIGFLKAGLQFADLITTVSPTYAAEMQTPEYGFGLDGLLRARTGAISGIINGIDTKVWNPLSDPRIPARYGRSALAKRAPNKTALQHRFGLNPDPVSLLIGVVSRFVRQKGLDLLADAAQTILECGGQLAMLGTGDVEIEQQLALLAAAHPGRIGCMIGYDEDVAHLIQAGADALLVPSRFEPCGLTQLCALHYGAVPIVAKVGGLADTVIDPGEAGGEKATGLHFSPVTREGLEGALRRVAHIWADQRQWRRMQLNGMRTDVSWKRSAAEYARLYAGLMATKN